MSNQEIWERRGETWGDRFTAHPILWTLAMICGLVLVFGALNFAFGWIGAATNVVSASHVRAEYQHVIEDYRSLQAAAANACEAEKANPGPGAEALVESPAQAYNARYRQVQVDYDRRMTNPWEAGIVGPSDCGGIECPRLAPTLTAMEGEVC